MWHSESGPALPPMIEDRSPGSPACCHVMPRGDAPPPVTLSKGNFGADAKTARGPCAAFSEIMKGPGGVASLILFQVWSSMKKFTKWETISLTAK